MPLKRLSLHQSLALWTLVPMGTFSIIVLVLSFGWAWRNMEEVASEHNAMVAYAAAAALGESRAQQGDPVASVCAMLADLSMHSRGAWYVLDQDRQVLCVSSGARLSVGAAFDYHLGKIEPPGPDLATSSLREQAYRVSLATIPGTPWSLALEEARSALLARTYSFLIAISALMIVGLFISFWLLWVGFNRIAWPLSAVTEQARRVSAGKAFVPPDVDGPAEVEALVDAFNRMVTQLRQQRDTVQDYAVRVVDSQEEERKRVSRDLHDETAQDLVGLMQRIDLCRLAAEDNPQVLTALDELSALTGRALSGVRRMSRALRPLILEDLGLVAALQAIAEDLDRQLPEGHVFCEVIGEERRLMPEIELTAFRIVQEALTNVRKHASDATRVYMTVHFKPDVLQISVEDNGRGFRPALTEGEIDGEHLGLMGMRERADLLNGTWAIRSRPGEGTWLSLELPVSSEIGASAA
jgi:two-component system sensor histidine kinase UhpB